ncbi:hypothetical protein ACU8KH_03984 [Lachancea thermotolerans]
MLHRQIYKTIKELMSIAETCLKALSSGDLDLQNVAHLCIKCSSANTHIMFPRELSIEILESKDSLAGICIYNAFECAELG